MKSHEIGWLVKKVPPLRGRAIFSPACGCQFKGGVQSTNQRGDPKMMSPRKVPEQSACMNRKYSKRMVS